jgi:hypothetical protein
MHPRGLLVLNCVTLMTNSYQRDALPATTQKVEL